LLRAIDFEAPGNAARPTKAIYTKGKRGVGWLTGWLKLVQILLTLLSLILIIACQPNSRTVRQEKGSKNNKKAKEKIEQLKKESQHARFSCSIFFKPIPPICR